jgi:hypothetical protein
MYRAVLLLLLVPAAEARAEGPWNIALGAGPAVHLRRYEYAAANDYTIGASARLDAGYRFLPSLAVGSHIGIAYTRGPVESGPEQRETYYVPFELGVGAQIVIADRALIAPWAGFLDIAGHGTLAGGTEVGYDLIVRGHDRVSGVATLTWAHQLHASVTYVSIGAGIAYRYW